MKILKKMSVKKGKPAKVKKYASLKSVKLQKLKPASIMEQKSTFFR